MLKIITCTRNFFFFSSRRRHTRYWRDWSSDVCSSDLHVIDSKARSGRSCSSAAATRSCVRALKVTRGSSGSTQARVDRKSVVLGKRVDLGGRRIIKKKKNGSITLSSI